MSIPSTKAARQARIVELLETVEVRSQSDLAAHLKADGISVTQATLSRDLVEVGAERVRGHSGVLIYAVRGSEAPKSMEEQPDRLAGIFRDLLVSARSSGNLVVLRTPPGAAQFLASALDQTKVPEAIGTIAGDDTVMVVSADPMGGRELAAKFMSWSTVAE